MIKHNFDYYKYKYCCLGCLFFSDGELASYIYKTIIQNKQKRMGWQITLQTGNW